jgi:inward rectifier potassium channel
MAIHSRIKLNKRAQSDDNTGFGINSSYSGGRFVNSKGEPNVHKRGLGIFEKYSLYHTFLGMPRWKFMLILLSTYIIINLFFASLYFLIGIKNLAGSVPGTPLDNYAEAFFFSAQTFTTVGYGRISPDGFLASSIATIEAFLGLLSFAIATGLFYGRFSRPQAYLKYSDIAIIAPYRGISAFMFRMAPYKNNNLLEAEAKVTLAIKVEENGMLTNKFYALSLELSKIYSLTASWTLVHPIDDKSPLYNLQHQDYKNLNAEFIVFIKAFDDTYSNTVTSVKSYIAHEIVFGAKFKVMYHPSENKKSTILYLDRINDIEKADLPKELTGLSSASSGSA